MTLKTRKLLFFYVTVKSVMYAGLTSFQKENKYTCP